MALVRRDLVKARVNVEAHSVDNACLVIDLTRIKIQANEELTHLKNEMAAKEAAPKSKLKALRAQVVQA